jgi:hypothetical protein
MYAECMFTETEKPALIRHLYSQTCAELKADLVKVLPMKQISEIEDKRFTFSLNTVSVRMPALESNVSDPDWIQIQSGQWIRIRNQDPDPGGQK